MALIRKPSALLTLPRASLLIHVRQLGVKALLELTFEKTPLKRASVQQLWFEDILNVNVREFRYDLETWSDNEVLKSFSSRCFIIFRIENLEDKFFILFWKIHHSSLMYPQICKSVELDNHSSVEHLSQCFNGEHSSNQQLESSRSALFVAWCHIARTAGKKTRTSVTR